MDNIINKIKNDEILNALKQVIGEHDIYLVGGYIRDLILEDCSCDRDIIVEHAPAKVVAQCLADKLHASFVPLDEVNHIYRVVLPDKLNYFDIVNPVNNSLRDDIYRRDFTINAIAFNLKTNELIDYTGGIEDLHAGKLVGISEENFVDDSLRLLRAFRFQSTLNFKLDEKLIDLIKKHADLILNPSVERINCEVTKLFGGKNAYNALKCMDDCGILVWILPVMERVKEIPPNTHHHLNLFEHSLEVVRQIELQYQNSNDAVRMHLEEHAFGEHSRLAMLKLAGFLHDIGKPDTWTIEADTGRHRFIKHDDLGAKLVQPILRKLKYSNKQISYVQKLIKYHIYPSSLVTSPEYSEKAKMRFIRKMEDEVIDSILLAKSDRLSARGVAVTDDVVQKNISSLEALLAFYLSIKDTLEPLPKLIDGCEIMKLLNIKASPKLGEIIEALKEEQISGNISTKEQAVEFILGYSVK